MGLFPSGRPRRNGANTPPIAATLWSAEDKVLLKKAIHRLQYSFQPFGFLRAEAIGLLCSPPAEVYDRLNAMFNNIAIISGLILSAIAGSALEQYSPGDFDAEMASFCEAYNAIAAVTATVMTCTTMYSTFTLYMINTSVHSPATAYRFVLNIAPMIGFLEAMTFVPALGCFALFALATRINCSDVTFYTVLGLIIFVWSAYHVLFIQLISWGVPWNIWNWGTVAAPWQLFQPLCCPARVDRIISNHGELLRAEAKDGVLAGVNLDAKAPSHPPSPDAYAAAPDAYVAAPDAYAAADGSSSSVPPAATDLSEEEAELAEWVRLVLSLEPTPSVLLVGELKAAGLTPQRMMEATRHPGGFQVLVEMLGNAQTSGLKPGDRLALAAFAMRMSDDSSTPGRRRRRTSAKSELEPPP